MKAHGLFMAATAAILSSIGALTAEAAPSVRATAAHLYPQPTGEARNTAGYAVTVDGQPAGVAAVRTRTCMSSPIRRRR